jgi:hypothetical protein
MSNAKVQMSNQIQITNEMPKQVWYDEAAILNLAFKEVQGLRSRNPFLSFDIPLTFGF